MLNKKLIAGAIFALVLFVGAGVVSASYDFGPTTLKVGSKGDYVKTLQTLVGATADGSFGPMTAAKVKVWQAANGLTADGLFGNMSKAKANLGLGGTVSGNFPAGCTSASGFSTLTGVACTAIPSMNAGCTAGALFSSTTGLSCTGTPTTPSTLTGGAGTVAIVGTDLDIESEVVLGQVDTKVLGMKATADGSDVKISNLKITLENKDTGTSSKRLERYVSSVSVFAGSTKIATVNAADFTKDGFIYTKSLTLADAIVMKGTNNYKYFYVTVTPVANFDSADITADFETKVSDVRYTDSTGVVLTNGTTVTDTSFTVAKTSSDVKLTVSKGASSPLAGNVEVSDTSSTSDVLMLEFKLKAAGSAMTFDQLKVFVNATIDQTVPKNLGAMLGELTLKEGSTTLARYSAFTAFVDQNVTFDLDQTYTIAKDTTKTFRIYAKINDVDNFTAGDSMFITLANADVLGLEDSAYNAVASRAGSAAGEPQTFIKDGAVVKYISGAYTAYDGNTLSEGTVSMKFSVTAFGDNDVVILENQGIEAASVTAAEKIHFTVDGVTGSGSIVTSTDLTPVSNKFTVTAGDTKTFTLSVKTGVSSGFVVLNILSVDGTVVSNVKTSPF